MGVEEPRAVQVSIVFDTEDYTLCKGDIVKAKARVFVEVQTGVFKPWKYGKVQFFCKSSYGVEVVYLKTIHGNAFINVNAIEPV